MARDPSYYPHRISKCQGFRVGFAERRELLNFAQRGEAREFEFELAWASFTDEERDQFMALMNERIAHGEEKLEALREDIRVLLALYELLERNGAPPGTTLWEAGEAGYIGVMQVVEAIRAMPVPLAGLGKRGA
jgi:hypothetical protein